MIVIRNVPPGKVGDLVRMIVASQFREREPIEGPPTRCAACGHEFDLDEACCIVDGCECRSCFF
jgi:hypothetical protein